VLNGLAAPGGSFAHRLFTAALEGLTLGGLGLEYHAPATGYAAFVALGIFFVGLLLLPHEVDAWDLVQSPPWGAEIQGRRPEPARLNRGDADAGGS
jgi:hypothetical protein